MATAAEQANPLSIARSGPLLFLLVAVLGCSAPRKESAVSFAIVHDQATVYIYRPSRFRPMSQCSVSVDGRWLHDLPMQSYARILVKPGEHTVLTRWSDGAVSQIDFLAEPGRNYFFKIGIDRARIDQAGITISREDESNGEKEVRSCDPAVRVRE